MFIPEKDFSKKKNDIYNKSFPGKQFRYRTHIPV